MSLVRLIAWEADQKRRQNGMDASSDLVHFLLGIASASIPGGLGLAAVFAAYQLAEYALKRDTILFDLAMFAGGYAARKSTP